MENSFQKPINFWFILIMATLLACSSPPEEKNPDPQFVFNLPDLSGKIVSLKDFEGKIFVINFWATWCPPCEEEIFKLNAIYERHKSKGLVVIGIALDKDSLNLVGSFVREKKIGYPVLMGDEQVLKGIENFSGVPTTLIVDQKGSIHKKYDGSFDGEDMEKNLRELLYK